MDVESVVLIQGNNFLSVALEDLSELVTALCKDHIAHEPYALTVIGVFPPATN